jgi:hypothetical protein
LKVSFVFGLYSAEAMISVQKRTLSEASLRMSFWLKEEHRDDALAKIIAFLKSSSGIFFKEDQEFRIAKGPKLVENHQLELNFEISGSLESIKLFKKSIGLFD